MGQVSRLQTRIITQPMATSGAGARSRIPRHPAARRWPRRGRSLACRRPRCATRLAQAVHDEGLVRLGKAQLPGQACVVDGVAGRCAGAAVIAGDQDHLGAWPWPTPAAIVPTPASLTSLTLMRARRICALQVVDQLGQMPRWSRCRGAAAERSVPTPGVEWRVLAIQG